MYANIFKCFFIWKKSILQKTESQDFPEMRQPLGLIHSDVVFNQLITLNVSYEISASFSIQHGQGSLKRQLLFFFG